MTNLRLVKRLGKNWLNLMQQINSNIVCNNVVGCRAPLFPKLRGQFAEFLQHSCLYHLGLLDLSTSVGLGTVDALDYSLFH